MTTPGKILVLRPIGGLCNRLRAMASAAVLAHWQGRSLRVLWHVNDELGARWNDLFEPAAGFEVADIPERGLAGLPLRVRHAYSMLPESRFPAFGAWLRNRCFDRAFFPGECRQRALAKTGYRDALECRRLLIVYYDWLVNAKYGFDFLRPRAELEARIGTVVSRFGPRTVGVHIRRTDSVEAIRRSPMELFEDRMEALIAADPATSFFLATDDPAVADRLAVRFGSRILPVERVYGRSGVAGIQSAVVDLWCLSRTSLVLGSYISSFSETAARLGGIELAILDKDQTAGR